MRELGRQTIVHVHQHAVRRQHVVRQHRLRVQRFANTQPPPWQKKRSGRRRPSVMADAGVSGLSGKRDSYTHTC